MEVQHALATIKNIEASGDDTILVEMMKEKFVNKNRRMNFDGWNNAAVKPFYNKI